MQCLKQNMKQFFSLIAFLFVYMYSFCVKKSSNHCMNNSTTLVVAFNRRTFENFTSTSCSKQNIKLIFSLFVFVLL